jgi:N-acetylglucosaminyldiphosphoundecaprenol N-acetyl-beta-D-mannosaminyltransferase
MDKFKANFPFSAGAPIAILGVPFDNVTTVETIRSIEQMIASRRPHYLATANVDFLVQAAHDVELRRILFDAHLVLCDGTPLVWASRLLGNPLPERVAGSDLVPLLLQLAAEKGYRPFLLGASPDSMEAAVARIKELHPTLQLAGYYSPPHSHLLEMDHDRIREQILSAQPDLLFVGFGCPKQEKWINMHYRSLGVPVSVGVGGTIDFLAGKLSRAPVWMQKSGSEWIFRLAQEPRRLFGRYAKDLSYFSRAILTQCWQLRSRRVSQPGAQQKLVATGNISFELIHFPQRLDYEEVDRRKQSLEAAITSERGCVLDLHSVDFIDSTGVGLLIRLQKRARHLGQQLLLLAPSPNVRRALEIMRLEEFFIMVPTISSAQETFSAVGISSRVCLKSNESSPFPVLYWSGELTAANSEEIWTSTMNHISARALVQRVLAINLENLRFVDSTGLGLMIRAKKLGARQGIKIRFEGARPTVLNVIRLSRLEEYLLKTE